MTFPIASGSQCAHLRLWNVILLLSEVPFASALTLETLAAHRAVRGLFKSRPSIFVGDLNGKDYPSRLARALVPVGMPILTHDRRRRNILVCRGGCRDCGRDLGKADDDPGVRVQVKDSVTARSRSLAAVAAHSDLMPRTMLGAIDDPYNLAVALTHGLHCPLRPRQATFALLGASVARATSAALDEIATALPEPIVSMSLRAWPADFPEDIAVQRHVPYESRADSVMYRSRCG
jgi:hypothetical protein